MPACQTLSLRARSWKGNVEKEHGLASWPASQTVISLTLLCSSRTTCIGTNSCARKSNLTAGSCGWFINVKREKFLETGLKKTSVSHKGGVASFATRLSTVSGSRAKRWPDTGKAMSSFWLLVATSKLGTFTNNQDEMEYLRILASHYLILFLLLCHALFWLLSQVMLRVAQPKKHGRFDHPLKTGRPHPSVRPFRTQAEEKNLDLIWFKSNVLTFKPEPSLQTLVLSPSQSMVGMGNQFSALR